MFIHKANNETDFNTELFKEQSANTTEESIDDLLRLLTVTEKHSNYFDDQIQINDTIDVSSEQSFTTSDEEVTLEPLLQTTRKKFI